jgi:hypothetical protein
VRTSEWIVTGYLAYLAVLAWVQPICWRRRAVVTVVALVDAAGLWWLSEARSGWRLIARDWLPAMQVLVAYWLSGAFVRQPMPRVEAWLMAGDRILFDRLGARALARQAPRWLLEYLELTYLTVYLVVPIGFGVVYHLAPGPPVDAYWTMVLTAELVCYGMLPWLQTRPPRTIGLHSDVEHRSVSLRRLNVLVLDGGSIQANTVPSGHVAGSLATALAAGTFVPAAFVPLLMLAASITIASVIGRYHYAADAALGVLVALAAWVIGNGT